MKKKIRPIQSVRWALTLLVWAFALSVTFSFASSQVIENIGMGAALLILFFFIFLGIVFDMVGVAAATAPENPLHSMASRRVPGSFEALRLVRRAERVSSFCNDLVGDICGIVSGATGAVIALWLAEKFPIPFLLTQLTVAGLIAGLTVGGKAFAKGFAMRFNTQIIWGIGRALYFISHLKK